MPETVKKTKSGKWQVVGPDGRVYGTHDTASEAYAQVSAIKHSKMRRSKK